VEANLRDLVGLSVPGKDPTGDAPRNPQQSAGATAPVAVRTAEVVPPTAAGAGPARAEVRGRDCEDLDGGAGREVFFRPQRYRPVDLGSVAGQVCIQDASGVALPCVLCDVSQNGVGFEQPDGVAFANGDVIPRLAVSFDGYDAYAGEARVVSVRTLPDGKVVVGASFVDSLMSIDDVLQLQNVSRWKGFDERGIDYVGSGWYVAGYENFKSMVGECRLFLEDFRGQMNALEASLPWHVVHVESDSPVRAALIHRIRSEFIPLCLQQSVQVDAALRAATGDDWQRLKEFSIRNVQDLFMTAPVLHRARIKPLGYPGDFEVMRYVYDQKFEGATLFGKAMHLFACACTGPAAVRSRKDMVKGLLRDRLRTWDQDRPLKVASVAAGPAQEIVEMLTESKEPLPPLELLLFDQDRLALSYAQGRVSRLVERHPNVKVTYLFDSIKRLLTDPTLFAGFGPFDIIFCAGLFDYLRFHTAVGLTRSFYANLAPGGSAYIGNMMPTNPGKWIFEHHLDWYLTYRSHGDMLDFGRAAVPGAQLEIVEEATGINPFLRVRRD
jgi:hypothetical protein